MKSENIVKACDSFEFFYSALGEAHTDAVNANNQFAELVIFSLLESAAKIRARLTQVRDAVNNGNERSENETNN